MASRVIQSPTSPFFLGSNEDKLERAQARAARAASIRRKPMAVNGPPPEHGESDPCLGKDQILELFHNCIKLASENKINQKNTWELNLIDHLYEIIKVEEENDVETNFQKASCTLEAGVKIYSLRADSVHSKTYKVLGGINRAGQENEQDTTVEDANVQNGQEEGHSKKDMGKKLSPLSTLESSFEALNVKKFDVDPLYHQTSAQFDEGGAKGLLLNNLVVYAGCQVLFDSQEAPGKGMSYADQHSMSDTIDLSFAREHIEQMVLNMQAKDEISPTIVNQFDQDNRRSSDGFSSVQKSTDPVEDVYNNEVEDDGVAFDNCGTYDFDHDDQPSIVDESLRGADPTFPSYHEESETFSFQEPGSKDDPAAQNGFPVTMKKTRSKRQAEADIDFTKALDEELPDLFGPSKNTKSLLMPGNRAPLIRDCLKIVTISQRIFALGRRGEESPQIQKKEVEYDKTSKQVDIQRLKETILVHMQDSPQMDIQGEEETVSFRQLLSSFPSNCKAAATINDISPHLCFICLLHLANEHGLSIQGCANLDDLSIHLPQK